LLLLAAELDDDYAEKTSRRKNKYAEFFLLVGEEQQGVLITICFEPQTYSFVSSFA
jgi:hypothetical protein